MYAVVKTGGKQYKVTVGEKLNVEQIPAELDSQIELEVLMIADGEKVTVGAPTVVGAKVVAKVVAHGRGEKVRIFKMRRRKHYQKRQGHRQNFTRIEILSIA
ncbi:50S ribosomal protein L21 [Kingella kingae]|uniref:50S ribosomal protein L21 n=1 Tax=Kingella kingae TaxID=504 RepID=UPI00031DBDCE|nr:50S ribosomal protein L21 [Kingella kingae]MDK4555622.1 50S ribosomal protein L21 [Kingella kingae]MDK4584689.1 50S ribosomal protein L21 [Kingella kingae]MDK4588711.1 50S ribosomal protein L21 [Kingella kingae]MDK4596931.1 50S ribosomal protein L21 [Kingella kingae]MDK4600897.1 50S ribosomal protein L21 [Kingella kingae]